MSEDEKLTKKIAIRLTPALNDRVMAKAKRESVNVSALVRSWLETWTEKDTPGEEVDSDGATLPDWLSSVRRHETARDALV